jgi:hypothetical protein
VAIDHIGGDTDPVDGVFDLTSDGLQLGHAFESPPRAAAAQLRNFPSEDVFHRPERFTFLKGLEVDPSCSGYIRDSRG